MSCIACGSTNMEKYETKVSDFLTERIYGLSEETLKPATLLRCADCGFAYYQNRFSEAEEVKIYEGYRSDEYQKMRQKHDIWYTEKINFALGNNHKGLQKRKKIIETICEKRISNHIKSALDYGGDMGQKYPDGLRIDEKYVYDISGVKTIDGVVGLLSLEDVKKHQYDFIMCNQVLEHIGNLDEFIETIKSIRNENTWYYFDVPYDTPFDKSLASNLQFVLNPYFSLITMARHFYRTKKRGYFAPMTEHVNFFTPTSMTCLFERHGFTIEYSCVSKIYDVLGISKIISILCKCTS